MIYNDYVHGTAQISEPVILELINNPTLQRLKEIDQIGYFEPYFPGTKHTRFEHSMGVFLTLKKYKAPLEEQIAGLIHDVSHSAFSHCIDYVLSSGSEKEHNHQDNIFDKFVEKSEIPEILEKYKIDWRYIINDEHFPLKEKNLPDLCADRIDYSLRTAFIFKELDKRGIDYFMNHLKTNKGKWFFKNFDSAKKYSELFSKLNKNYYSGLPSAVMFRTVGDYLQYALQKEYISKEDLYTTDKKVLSKIEKYLDKDKKLKLLFDRMNNKIKFENNPNNFDAIVFCKSRIIDPLCIYNKELLRVSDIDLNWKKILKQELEPKEYFIKFER